MRHLSDHELIDYTIRYSTNPTEVRLATIMQRLQGGVVDDLISAGMEDGPFMEFRSEINGSMYTPGLYISHLENEINFLNRECGDLRDELDKLKARTVLELLAELKEQIAQANIERDNARQERDRARINEQRTNDKMKVWRALSTDTTVQ